MIDDKQFYSPKEVADLHVIPKANNAKTVREKYFQDRHIQQKYNLIVKCYGEVERGNDEYELCRYWIQGKDLKRLIEDKKNGKL